MPYQPQLFAELPAAPNGPESRTPQVHAPPPPPMPPEYPHAPVWLQRVSLFILVVFCIYLGGIVAVLPWLASLWDRNLLLRAHPALWAVLKTFPARGFISGLGLLDIWIGISEAVHYRDRRR